MRIAYLATGKLYLIDAGQTTEIRSAFAQDVMDRSLRSQQRHAWKGGERDGKSAYSNAMLWGSQQPGDQAPPIRFEAVSRGAASGELLYVLTTESIGGVFEYDITSQSETRMFHRENFRATDLALHPDGQRSAATVFSQHGSHIAVGEGDGRRLVEVTEGDALDGAPSWDPKHGSRVIFHTAGIIRNGHGHPIGTGPATIESLDTETGEMHTLLESVSHDLLQPKIDREENLWFIRRPYEALGKRVSFWEMLKDVVLFPFRLIRAIVLFFNTFSLFFAKKPLLNSAGGPKRPEEELQRMVLWGKLVDAGKNTGAQGSQVEAIVPRDWTLVRRDPNGSETIMAHHVGSFDINAEGVVVFSTGIGIFELQAGKTRKLSGGFLIETVRFAE